MEDNAAPHGKDAADADSFSIHGSFTPVACLREEPGRRHDSASAGRRTPERTCPTSRNSDVSGVVHKLLYCRTTRNCPLVGGRRRRAGRARSVGTAIVESPFMLQRPAPPFKNPRAMLKRKTTSSGPAIARPAAASTGLTRRVARPGDTCWRRERAGRASFLVDAADYFRALRSSIIKAERSVALLGWDVHSKTPLIPGDPERMAADGWPVRFGDLLLEAVRRNRRLRIYVLSWDFAVVFALDREILPLYRLPGCSRTVPRGGPTGGAVREVCGRSAQRSVDRRERMHPWHS